jgi:HlyD family secretion protein
MRRLLSNRRVLLSAAVVGALLAVALWPDRTPVDVGTVTRGPLVVTVDEEGETRVHDRFVVSAPIGGRVLRIELEPGDAVKKGEVVARLQPGAAPLLDARTRAEARAAVETARAALGSARAEEQRLRAALAQARSDLTRAKQLSESGLTTQQDLEAKVTAESTARDALRAASYAVASAESELQGAQARLAPTAVDAPGGIVEVRSPVDGVVLKRDRESESVVPAGDPLVEIGDPRNLEIVSDLLSTDAVRVRAGARAMIEQWGGDRVLDARVRRVEPSGFTKISALGVEEQRVNVVLDFADPAQAWSALGDAYRVEVRIVIWEKPDVLKVPTSALFREGDRWAVYTIAGGRAHRTYVELGERTGQEAQVKAGLAAGTPIVLHPGDTLTDDARVQPRGQQG